MEFSICFVVIFFESFPKIMYRISVYGYLDYHLLVKMKMKEKHFIFIFYFLYLNLEQCCSALLLSHYTDKQVLVLCWTNQELDTAGTRLSYNSFTARGAASTKNIL